MAVPIFLIINVGSSSIKFSVFNSLSLDRIYVGITFPTNGKLNFHVKSDTGEIIKQEVYESSDEIELILNWLNKTNNIRIIGIAHRIVHGGHQYTEPTLVNRNLLDELRNFAPLAPLHQPIQLEAINTLIRLAPEIKQIACFDTSFHKTQTNLSRCYALPNGDTSIPIMRYGFHGISYAYIVSVLSNYLTSEDQEKVIVAHLGNGASLCAIKNNESVTTTMGFTPLDGLVMGTRCGSIDPGIILYILKEKQLSLKEMERYLYEECGLKGLSGISHDMKILLASNQPSAKLAIDIFCYQAAKQLASLIPTLDGVNSIIFTAGIGENSPEVRQKICQYFSWINLIIDSNANKSNATKISASNSAVNVYVIPTNEDMMMAKFIKPFFNEDELHEKN